MHLQAQGYFVKQEIGNVNQDFPEPLLVSALQNLSSGDAPEIVNLHDRVFSDMISKTIGGSIANTSL